MQVIRGLVNSGKIPAGCVATIGNFDGVHLGHQAVIRKLAGKAGQLGLPSAVILFEPQPMEFFRCDDAPARLLRFGEKVRLLGELPVDYVVVLRFGSALANLEPEAFVRTVLTGGLGVRHLVVGDDFRFGYRRHGDFQLLVKLADVAGFAVEDTGSQTIDGQRVSSTLIRDSLHEGDLEAARRMLGRPYSVRGRVIRGDEKGRTIGFPTANIRMHGRKSAVEGVFAVTMSGINGLERPGVANVGCRPTVGATADILLETHLFDFQGNIYGKKVEVRFLKKIRDEIRFGSLEELRHQIAQDVRVARDLLDSADPTA